MRHCNVQYTGKRAASNCELWRTGRHYSGTACCSIWGGRRLQSGCQDLGCYRSWLRCTSSSHSQVQDLGQHSVLPELQTAFACPLPLSPLLPALRLEFLKVRALVAGTRQVANEYKLRLNIRIAMLYLEDDDSVTAELYIKRASALIASCKVQNPPL